MNRIECDTLIIGAGIIGSSVAMHLGKQGVSDVRVIDFDLEGSLSSTELNAGGVRATWIQPINIQMSRLTIDYLAKHEEELGYKSCGYLWLHGEERLKAALKAREAQLQEGWSVEVFDVPALKRHIPFIDRTEGIAGAVFAPRDGLVNSNLVKNHFRAKARAAGVRFEDRCWVKSAEHQTDGIEICVEVFPAELDQEQKLKTLGRVESQGSAGFFPHALRMYKAKRVVNCAGAWASQLAKILGYPCRSYAMRRQVSVFDSREVDLSTYGMIVDTSGVYFHPEASNGLAGYASYVEPHGINFHYDGEDFFNEWIWPALAARSSGFERLKHLTGWAGLYEVSPDECAVIGPVELGEHRNSGRLFEAHSFSGHGIMHSYAAGLALAERMVQGTYQTMDATVLSGSRFETGQLVKETLVI
jgi:glycine/D-amino acid oxidase-like deaminating enzyme